MTIQITEVDHGRNEAVLQDTPADPAERPDCYARPMASSIGVHVRAACPIVVRLHRDDNRVVVKFANDTTDLALFLSADQVDRLIDVFTVTRDELNRPVPADLVKA
jgi:hypothetical protein